MIINLNYDDLAQAYARHRGAHPGVLQALAMAESLHPGARTLEVGCGTGNYIIAIEQATGCRGWGLDPSRQMLLRLHERARTIRTLEGRAERLSFAEATFDLVFSVDVIHHVQDRDAYYREAWRVLKPGGLLCTVTDSEEIIRQRQPLSEYFPESVAVELRRYPQIPDLEDLMRLAGFTGLRLAQVAASYALVDPGPFREKAYSSLHLIPQEAFERGIQRIEYDLRQRGQIPCVARYVLLWGIKERLN